MVEESPRLLPPAEESIEAETDTALEPEPESGEPTPELASEPGFVCDCEEEMRSACKRLPFYKEHENRRYCVLHYPGKEKSADFKAALDSKLNNKDFDFQGVWFPDDVHFTCFEFTSAANFSSATFREAASFIGATFHAAAFFGDARHTSDLPRSARLRTSALPRSARLRTSLPRSALRRTSSMPRSARTRNSTMPHSAQMWTSSLSRSSRMPTSATHSFTERQTLCVLPSMIPLASSEAQQKGT